MASPSPRDNGHGRAPADLSHHLNETARSRTQSAIKGLYKYFMLPGMANLAGGLPYPGYFPFDTLEAVVATPERFVASLAGGVHGLHLSDANNEKQPSSSAPSASILRRLFATPAPPQPQPQPASEPEPASEHLLVPKFSKSGSLPQSRIDLATTLQYGQATGLAPLYEFIKEFALEYLHNGQIPYDDPAPDVLLTCGSTDGFSKVLATFGSRGDHLLVEEFCYMNAVQTARPLGIDVVPVKMDSDGMMAEGPGGLRDVLENWDEAKQGRKPHLLYTVSIGQNPTGLTLQLPRRKELYALCDEHDILLVEDDPYWYLQYTPPPKSTTRDLEKHRTTAYPFLQSLTPSFLTIDVSGRVIRLDTFSKTIAPGCRLGWITAQPSICERILRVTECSTQQPSGFVQSMVAQLLIKNWGMDGWVEWLSSLRDQYQHRMEVMCHELIANSTHIISRDVVDGQNRRTSMVSISEKPLYSFIVPDGGMFVWVKMHFTEHPAFQAFIDRGHTLPKFAEKLWDYGAMKKKALPSPGGVFAPTEEIQAGPASEYFRFCFAAIEIDELRDATKRWAEGVKEFWEMSAKEIEKIGLDTDAQLQQQEVMRGARFVSGFGC